MTLNCMSFGGDLGKSAPPDDLGASSEQRKLTFTSRHCAQRAPFWCRLRWRQLPEHFRPDVLFCELIWGIKAFKIRGRFLRCEGRPRPVPHPDRLQAMPRVRRMHAVSGGGGGGVITSSPP
ncbi:unnamed protein product [Mesocestoides corti]|uniref:Uncharacterized protein n=1 Tax=Mesocestoides corti TaxID=53468 RepID=A0A0R3U6L2_MESCO|nr:unnamed protein product [Mesocestoides corti]